LHTSEVDHLLYKWLLLPHHLVFIGHQQLFQQPPIILDD
jgi:1-acyl-sn-glycerol-3-phosphate acyltransferase